MDRALRANIIAKSGKAVEVAGDIDTLLLDKTGTITIGNRRATQFVPLGDARGDRGRPAGGAGLAPPTRRPRARASSSCTAGTPGATARPSPPPGSRFVAFTAQTRMSGVDLPDGRAHPQGRARRRR